MKMLSKIALTLFVLNLAWEFLHYPLYVDLSGIAHFLHLITASITDVFMVLGIYAVVSLKNRNLKWMDKPSRWDFCLIISVGLAVAVLIELINLNLSRWEYTSAMPTLFGIGLSPLVQLASTGALPFLLKNLNLKSSHAAK